MSADTQTPKCYVLLHFRLRMVARGCLNLIKYILFLFNFLFCIIGAVLLSFGIWIVLDETSFFIPDPAIIPFSMLSYALMIGGSVTLFIGFFGCLGALKEVKCMLGMYFFLISFLLAGQIVGAILVYTQKTVFEREVKRHVIELMGSFRQNESDDWYFKKTLDYVQQEIRCCGWTEPTDWVVMPVSCYPPGNSTIFQLALNHSEICDCHSVQCFPFCEPYKDMCMGRITDWLDKHWIIIFGLLLAVVTLELCGLTISMCLYRQTHVDYAILMYHK
ncbi:hypothetical protein DPEC_G00356730 [Dallia pectoralis]|uniref:Uncharacterized protein n=1 Tax=Dallia pectoralis TaxID=75939 RepID=A0ACC2EZU5_DALPE|nr:hypothetical protein DPEC_G00356730 [Dallia pectoralis]